MGRPGLGAGLAALTQHSLPLLTVVSPSEPPRPSSSGLAAGTSSSQLGLQPLAQQARSHQRRAWSLHPLQRQAGSLAD